MTDTPNRPPLWEVMRDAYELSPLPVDANLDQIYRNVYAAEIRALRDRMAAEMLQLSTCSCCDVMRAKVTNWLTAEADRAERAEVEP